MILTVVLTALFAAQRIGAQVPARSQPSMTAKLIDPEKKAAGQAATVEVTVSGVQLKPSGTPEKKSGY